MEEIGVEHFRIELIEEAPCENIEQLRAIEGKYIRKTWNIEQSSSRKN